MLLGIRHRSIEVIAIHKFEDLLKHVPLLTIHLTGVLSRAEHQHQVVPLTQQGGATKGLHQGRDVLATIGPADRQQGRSIGIPQKRAQQLGDLGRLIGTGEGVEASCIHARRNHLGTLRLEASVAGILFIALLSRAGDDEIGMGQRQFLGVNAPADRIRLFDLLVITTGREQSAQFLATEGMTREHEGNPEPTTHQCTHITSIGVMGVDPIRTILRNLKVTN